MLAEPSDKNFSKTGVTTSGIAIASVAKIVKDYGETGHITWFGVAALVASVLATLFRRYSDGKSPRIV